MIEFINTIGDVQLCLDPLVSASLITAGAGLINGIGNFFGAKSTNSLNARTAREINQKQIDFAREMNASEQAYNSIGEQMKRGMAAGVNPMLFAGAQPTSASSPGVPSLDTPVAQNPFAGVGVGATGTNIAQLVMQDKQQQLQQQSIDVSDFQARVEMLKTVAQASGQFDFTASEMTDVIKSIFGDRYDGVDIPSLSRDSLIQTKIHNAIETSNLDLKEKKYLYDWLDEFTNARYTNLLADTEQKQTQSKVNRSIANMNESKRKEYDQAVKNMQEQWKSLHFEGELSLEKLKKVAQISDDIVRKFHYDSGVSELDFRNYLFNKYLSSSGQFGGLFGTASGIIHGFASPDSNF